MNRRNLLPAAAASVMLPGAVKAAVPQPHADAELIGACDQFLSIQRAWEAYSKANPDDIEAGDPAIAMLEPLSSLVEQIVALRATTAEGILARARCRSFHWLPQAHVCQVNPEDAPEDQMIAAEMRDLVAMERGAVISRPVVVQAPCRHPDADLLAACAAFDALERAYVAAVGNYEPGSDEQVVAEAEQERVSDAQGPLIKRMCSLHATTREGHAARARSLALWDAELMKPARGDTGKSLTAAIVRDLLAGSAVA